MRCGWTNWLDREDMTFDERVEFKEQFCDREATHTNCDPVGALVCQEHKCRCSKPLDRETNKPIDWAYVEAFAAGVAHGRRKT